MKTVVPADVDFMVRDVLDMLALQLPRYWALHDVDEAIAKLDKGNVDRLVQLSGAATTEAQKLQDDVVTSDVDDLHVSDDDRVQNASPDDASEHSADSASELEEDEERDFDRWDRHRAANSRSDDTNKAFELDFERLVLESVEQRKFEKKTIQNLTDPSAFSNVATKPVSYEDGSQVVFQMLTRKSNKTHTKALPIPSDVGLAAKTLQEKRIAIEEQKTLRRLVIAGMQREYAEEQKRDLQGSNPVNIDRQLDIDLSFRNFDPKSTPISSGRTRGYRGVAGGRRTLLGRGGSVFGSSNGSATR